jgi:opacity protein-like surface antigen
MKLLQIIGLSTLALSISSFSQAHEINIGTAEIAGSSSLGLTNRSTELKSSSSTTIDSTSFDVGFGVSYYFRDNVAVGLRQEYVSTKTEYDDDSEETQTSSLLIPNVSFNLPLNDDASMNFAAGFVLASQEIENDIVDDKASGTGINLKAELRYFLRENISLNFGAEYMDYSVEYDKADVKVDTNGLKLGAGASMYFF